MTIGPLDFDGALDAYVKQIIEFADERGDRVVMQEDCGGCWILGIMTSDGHPLSLALNYTP